MHHEHVYSLSIVVRMLFLSYEIVIGFSAGTLNFKIKTQRMLSSGFQSHALGGQFMSPKREIDHPENRYCYSLLFYNLI